MKAFSLVTAGFFSLSLLACFPKPSQAQDCVNYWMNPRTGKSECFDGRPLTDTVSSGTATAKSGVEFLNQLKRCLPTVWTAPNPFLSGVTSRITTYGRVGDRCQIDYVNLLPQTQGKEWLYMRCRYSQPTIALMTDKKAYAEMFSFDAGKGNFSFSTSNPRDKTLSDRMSQECKFFGPPK